MRLVYYVLYMRMTHSWYTREGNILPFIPHFHHIHSHNTKMYIHILGNGTHRVPLFTKYTIYQPSYVFIKKLLFLFYNGCEAGCVSYCSIKI